MATDFSVQVIVIVQLVGARLLSGTSGHSMSADGFGKSWLTELAHQRATSAAARSCAWVQPGTAERVPSQAPGVAMSLVIEVWKPAGPGLGFGMLTAPPTAMRISSPRF